MSLGPLAARDPSGERLPTSPKQRRGHSLSLEFLSKNTPKRQSPAPSLCKLPLNADALSHSANKTVTSDE